jgi:regulator of cell morphogenesis and NO signaling
MQLTETMTVRDIAAGSLGAVRLFEKLGIDYCCGGKRPLAEACTEKGYDPAAIQRLLAEAMDKAPALEHDWNTAPLEELAAHIVNTHHEYLRRELPAVEARLQKVYRVYNQRYGPTLEGAVLFPAVVAAERALTSGQPLPRTPFGSVGNPIAMMEAEHESAGQALAKIREITGNYSVPEHGCVTYRALMSGLDELERDLHLHIHLENNILFPRAERAEAAASN